MARPWHNSPYAEEYQQAAYNGFPGVPEFGYRRNAPREEPFIRWDVGNQGQGWYQGPKKLPGFRSKKYWVRPVDGAHRGTWGRIKDGLTGEGPDVFVVANGDRRTFMREMPSRERWSNWDSTGVWWLDSNLSARIEDMDWYPKANFGAAPWAGRKNAKVYNFRTRKYEHLTGTNGIGFWSDAYWPRGKRQRRGSDHPSCWRDALGNWNTDIPANAGLWSGGRPLQ